MNKIAFMFLWFVIFFVIALSLIYTLIAAPAADDFCRAVNPLEAGNWLEYAANSYRTWTGRWVAAGIYGWAFPRLVIDSYHYTIILLLTWPIWVLSFYLICRLFYQNELSSSQCILLALIITTVFWAEMPAPGEVWYWATGMVEYQLPFLILVLGASTMATLSASGVSTARRIAAFAGAAVLGGLIGGLNELMAVYFMGFGSLCLTVMLLRRRFGAALMLGALLILAFIGFYVSVSAPGNAIRRATDFPNSMQPLYVARAFVADLKDSLLAWLVSPMVWALAILILAKHDLRRCLALNTAREAPRRAWINNLPVIVSVSLLAELLGRSIVAAGQGIMLPGRVSDLLFAIFLSTLLAVLPALARALSGTRLAPTTWHPIVGRLAAIVLAVSLVSAPNTSDGITDFRDTIKEYAPKIALRRMQMQSESAASAVKLRKLNFKPRLYFSSELNEDPMHWANACYAKFYRVNSVAIHH